MSWNRQIRIFYTISSNLFYFILWNTITGMMAIGGNDYKLFLLSMASAFLFQYFLIKKHNKAITYAIPMAAGILPQLLFYPLLNTLINSIFIIFIVLIANMSENEEVSYVVYRYRVKQSLIVIVLLGLLIIFTKLLGGITIIRFFVIFLISAIILLRELRNYSYTLRDKRTLKTNIGITAAIIILSLDFVFNVVSTGFMFIFKSLHAVFTKLVEYIILLTQGPVQKSYDYLSKKFTYKGVTINPQGGKQEEEQLIQDFLEKNNYFKTLITHILEALVLIIILYGIYLFIKSYRGKDQKETSSELVEKEKITKVKTQKESFIKRALKNIFRTLTFKEQVLNVYKKFEEKTYEKGIYKEHMTAKQLENVTKTYIENPEGLPELTEVYNKTKFSMHDVTKEAVEAAKESYGKVRKQL